MINQKAPEGEYVTRWEEIQILPDVSEAIALLNEAGFRVIVVSNQRCVAKGLITTADLEALHRRLCEVLASAGAKIDAIYYCPHEIETPCRCRKPQPGMLFDAARAHGIDLTASWMIGDSDIDVEAGRKAACRTGRVLSTEEKINGNADVAAPSLREVVDQILRQPQRDESRAV